MLACARRCVTYAFSAPILDHSQQLLNSGAQISHLRAAKINVSSFVGRIPTCSYTGAFP